MNVRAEETKWFGCKYPYDEAACGFCASGHALNNCFDPKHAAMRRAAKRLGLTTPGSEEFNAKLIAKFRTFRKKFAKFYPKRKRQQKA